MTVFDDSRLDDAAVMRGLEPTLRSLADWGAQVRRASAGAETPSPQDQPSRPRAVVAAGRDGRLLRTVMEPTCPVPFVAWPHPGLPGWAGPLDLCVALSVTGSEPETLGLVNEALRRGSDVVAACPPESPLEDLVSGRGTVLAASATEPLCLAVPLLRVLHHRGLGPDVEPEPVADVLDEVALRCAPTQPTGENSAKELALVVADSVPIVWGGSALAARAARRVAEQLRVASGRPAVAGDESQVVPLLSRAPQRDIFADPLLDDDVAVRPTLVLLDDGADNEASEQARERVQEAASRADVPVHTLTATEGPQIARFGSLLLTGAFGAAYLAAALGHD
jgi:hypothetical protein